MWWLWFYYWNYVLKWYDFDINLKIGLYGEILLVVVVLFNKNEVVYYFLKEEVDLFINILFGVNVLYLVILGGSCVIIEKYIVMFL